MNYESGLPMFDAASTRLHQVLRDFAAWAMRELLWAIVIVLVVTAIFVESPLARDDTDAGPGWFDDRSNMKPLTDGKTGCQYLAGEKGGLTPRLTYDGKHMGCNQIFQLKGNNQ